MNVGNNQYPSYGQQYVPQYQPQYIPQPYQPQYQPQYQSQYQSQYSPQYQQSEGIIEWFRRRPWATKIFGALMVIVVLILLYNYGCEIPIISFLCPIIRSLSSMMSGISSVFGFLNPF